MITKFSGRRSFVFKHPFETQIIQKYSKYNFDPFKFKVSPKRFIPSFIETPPWIDNEKPVYGAQERTIKVYNEEDCQKKIRKAAQIAASTLEYISKNTKVGMSGDEVDALIHDYIISQEAYPSGVGFMGFPKSVCISTNNILCHGIPNTRRFVDGDWANFDVTCYKDGFYGDTSKMMFFGEVDPLILKMSKICQECMYIAIKLCKPGQKYEEISKAVTEHAESNGFFVDPHFTGHGIGEFLHAAPTIMHNCNFFVFFKFQIIIQQTKAI